MEENVKPPDLDLRSPEVDEIINFVPPSLIRWGLLTLFVIITGLFLATWFIEYPDILPAKVTITTSPPPSSIVARTSGNVFFYKKENDDVHKNEVIGYLQTNIPPSTIYELEDAVNAPSPDLNKGLAHTAGEFEVDYGAFLNASENLRIFNETRSYEQQIEQLEIQKATYLKLNKALQSQIKLSDQELALARQKYAVDSSLYAQKVTSQIDFNKEKSTWLQQQRMMNIAINSLLQNENQINQLGKQINDLEIQQIERRSQLDLTLRNSVRSLLAHIEKWKETYFLTAPIDGKVAIVGGLENGMFMNTGTSLITVIPVNDSLIAKAALPIRNSGKVTVGQKVNIKLENYPFEPYGVIRGVVSAISLVPNDDKYYISIALPDKLKTSLGTKLVFKQQLSGTTEIITEDLKLVERFFQQLRASISRSS